MRGRCVQFFPVSEGVNGVVIALDDPKSGQHLANLVLMNSPAGFEMGAEVDIAISKHKIDAKAA